MAKFLKSVGESYTDYVDADPSASLGRGLKQNAKGEQIEPKSLPGFLTDGHRLQMRQIIAVLDKTVKKGRRLSHMNPDAYLHRAVLAGRLWTRLINRIDESDQPLNEDAKKKLLRSWQSKAHPYAEKDVNPDHPLSDDNGQKIDSLKEEGKLDKRALDFANFEGVWFPVFFGSKQSTGCHAEKVV